MASSWSALKIELLETGANSGTWGTATNVNLGDALLGEAITGSATVNFATDADVTVTLTDSATSQSARNLRLNITESSTGIGSVRNLILGSGCQIEKFYLVNNTGTGAKTIKNTSGTGISVPAGRATLVYNDGTNVVDGASYFTSLTLGSALLVASGGTGLTAGTSGGVLAYTASGTLASSGALTASALVLGGGAGVAPTPMGSLGTTTTVLHGNAGGAPTFSAVSLTADITGTLAPANGGTGVSNNAAMTVTGSGNFAYTRTLTGTTNVTFPTTGTLATLAGTETFTNKTITGTKETVFTITDGAAFEINPANGGIQTITLGANRTPAATNFTAGQSVTLMIDDGSAYAITWTTINPTFVGASATGSAPTLATSGYNILEMWKVGSTIYAAFVGVA